MKITEQFICDGDGNKIGVYLSIADYRKLRLLAEKSEHITNAEDIQPEEAVTEEMRIDKIMEEIDQDIF